MLTRYSRGADGKPVKKAIVYTSDEHAIDRRNVDHDAMRIVERLASFGHEAYIVGGAVRDLLIGRIPKDFDIVTDAQPPRIRHIFRSSRVIGRRFRLVHVYAGPKIFEVSTFRSISHGTIGNVYGSIDEDALRRDFSLNALYYDPVRNQVIDYVDGIKDIRLRIIKPVIPLKAIFDEDPVRMLRAAKYAAICGFKIGMLTRWTLLAKSPLLAGASHSRLSEELIKIIGSGKAREIFLNLESLRLIKHFMPALAYACRDEKRRMALHASLAELDAHVCSGGERKLSVLLGYLIRDEVERVCAFPGDHNDPHEGFRWALNSARSFLEPLSMPRADLEAAVSGIFVFTEQAASPRRKPRRRGGRRGSRPAVILD